MAYALGVDIGGTKIAAVIIDQHGEIHNRSEVESAPSDKEKMFEQVVKSIEIVLENSKVSLQDIDGIGVGVPGKIDQENGVAVYQNNLPWRNFPIVERLKIYFSISNITLDNDVYMAAFSEWKTSNTDKRDTFVYVTVSTGVSCSIIHQGSFLRGAGFAGEIGLFPVVAKSSLNGIRRLEKSASGPAIQQLAKRNINNFNRTTRDLFLKYEAGHLQAQEVMEEVVASLAHGVYSIVCLLDPDKIVFGGGVINNHPYLVDLVKESLANYLIPEQQGTLTRIQPSSLKENAGVIGAGLRVMQEVSDLNKKCVKPIK